MSYRKSLKAHASRSFANMAVIVWQIVDEFGRLNHLGQRTADAAHPRRKRAAGVIEAVAQRGEGVKRCC
jgi:hypothetical protein